MSWRYENAGTADTLIIAGTTLTDLPESKSVTGTAFYQTTRAKCFDLPATSEVWIKFDIFFDGSNRWRAFNGGANGTTGITAQTTDSNKIISVFCNEANVQQTYGFSIPNQLQTVLLHMVSDSSAGVVEAWVDGAKIYTYTGDVNHGEDFADIYLQSDGAGTFFSNVVISDEEPALDALGNFCFDADTVRQVVNALGQTQSIRFDGNSSCYGLLPLKVLAGATTFTIEAKFSTTSKYSWAAIFGRDIPTRWQNDFILGVDGGKLGFWAEPKTGGSDSTCITRTDAVVNDGSVHEVAVVSSEGAIDLYCDGSLVAHTDNVNAKITETYQIPIANNLRMDLYEARLWSVARTQKEIFAPLQGDEQGLEAYYLPEVRTDNILPDLSGNENHATLYGSAGVFPFDFVFDADTVVKIYKDKIQEQLTIWLPFNNYPTEDLCGNWWISTNPNIIIHPLSSEEADDNHSVALYLTSPTGSDQGQLVLNCQGMYLGGKDFTVSFDWWYGGAPPFSDNYPFGLWDENYSAEGSIYIYNYERFNANWNLTSLRAFGQSTSEFNIQYRSWHSIEVRYLHPEGRLVFFCDGSGLASLEVTIPRTFFPHVEIERAAPAAHGTGFISNLKISGGEVAPDCPNKSILLCIRHNGEVIQLPFRAYEFVDHLALAVRYDGRNWYNVLRSPADEHASDFYIKHAESTYALTKG